MLETASKGTSQDTERIQPSEWHSRTGHGMGRDMSGHEKRSDQAEALTNWRRHREGQIRIQKEYNRARGTHILETALGGTSQDTERIRPSKGHSHAGDSIGWDMSGRGKNPTQRGALTFWRRRQEGQVSTRKESDQARGTYSLATASGGTSQDTERIRPSGGHSHPGDSTGRDKSAHRKNPSERGALTSWIQHGVGKVRTQKESDPASGTHFLETASGWTSQHTE